MTKTSKMANRHNVAINEVVRSAVARTTGALTVVERAGSDEDHWLGIDEEWAVICRTHGNHATGCDSRREAWLVSTHPEEFCPICAEIYKFNKSIALMMEV